MLVFSVFGCQVDDTSSTSSVKSEASELQVVRKDLLTSGFSLETNNEDDLAILASPDTITFNSVYNELVKDNSTYIVVTGKVKATKAFEYADHKNGFSLTTVEVTKVHETKPYDNAMKIGETVNVYECYYKKEDKIGAAVIGFSPPNESWYYSPLLIEGDEYIFFLKDQANSTASQLAKSELDGNIFWYNHAAFKLNFEYIDKYPDKVSTQELIKMYAEGKIGKSTCFYQMHSAAIKKYGK